MAPNCCGGSRPCRVRGRQVAGSSSGLLGKRLGVQPDGWEDKAADWPSIADVAGFDDVAVLREQKRAMKAKKEV